MSRIYNFSAGPTVLPEDIPKEVATEALDYRGTGMLMMEMGHRSKVHNIVIKEAESDLWDLLHIPDNYKALFLQGGVSQRFAMMPMNPVKDKTADYTLTGRWAKEMHQEGIIYGKANTVMSSADKAFSCIPGCSDLPVSEDADYVYICENDTTCGAKCWTLPNTKGKLLVADQSSCFLSEPVDVTKYGLILAGVQKNVGPTGTVIVIVGEDLVTEDMLPGTSTMLRYKIYVGAEPLHNTPPIYGTYMCGRISKWLKTGGGLETMKEYNEKKAEILYNLPDENQLFKGTVAKKDHSLTNVPFVTRDEEPDALSVRESRVAGFENLKGHRTVGGTHASIYNAMPAEGVGRLAGSMVDFERKYRK